jgi:hypothetical protein
MIPPYLLEQWNETSFKICRRVLLKISSPRCDRGVPFFRTKKLNLYMTAEICISQENSGGDCKYGGAFSYFFPIYDPHGEIKNVSSYIAALKNNYFSRKQQQEKISYQVSPNWIH